MKLLKRGLLGLVGLLVLLAGIGLLLPAEFRVERSVQIAAPAERVYALVAAPREWKRWSVWNQRDPAMQVSYGGAESGAGARWSWQSASEGNGEMEFTAAEPNSQISYKLHFADVGMTSTGLLRIEPRANGVRVHWSNEGTMGANPLHRWFAQFMDRLVGPDFEAGLANLKRVAEGG